MMKDGGRSPRNPRTWHVKLSTLPTSINTSESPRIRTSGFEPKKERTNRPLSIWLLSVIDRRNCESNGVNRPPVSKKPFIFVWMTQGHSEKIKSVLKRNVISHYDTFKHCAEKRFFSREHKSWPCVYFPALFSLLSYEGKRNKWTL